MNPKRSLLRVASASGVDQSLLSLYDSVVGFGDVPVDDDVAGYERESEAREGCVVFTLVPGYETLCYRFCIQAHAFRTRGYEPIILRDDGSLPADPAKTVDSGGMAPAAGRYLSRRIPEQFDIETRAVGSLVDADAADAVSVDPDDDSAVRGVDVGRLAMASLQKRLKVYSPDFDDPSVRAAYARFVRSAALLVSATEALLDAVEPTAVVVNEPAYVQGGAPLAVARGRGLPAYAQMFGYHDETLLTSGGGRATLPQFAPTEWVRRAIDRPLTPAEREAIAELMQGREEGTDVAVQYVPTTDRSVRTGDETAVGVFTNLLWDASLTPETAVYADVFRWLADTIEVLGDRDDVHLILKTHPAEAKFGTRESVTGWLDRTYEALPENVTVLEPDTEVNTYRLIEDIDVGVVYNSTVGLEMAYGGTPVVVAGETHYRNLGFTVDPDSPAAYRRRIDDVAGIEPPPDQRDLAARYAHLLFVRRHLRFPYVSRTGGHDFDLRPVAHADLTPGNEPWDALVGAITEGREVVRPAYAGTDTDTSAAQSR
jgi:hypothetical protein